VVVTEAVDHRVCCAVDLGHWLVQGIGQPDLHLELRRGRAAQHRQKVPPVVAKPTQEGAVFAFTYLSFTGSGMLIAAIISGFVMGFSPGRMIRAYGETYG
jgi:L-lactate permease